MSHTLYAFLEPVVVALIVIVSALAVLRSQAPAAWKWLTGRAPRSAGCHDNDSSCGSGCGGCGSASTPSGEQTIHLHKPQLKRDHAS
jgi:hypothetical protein